MARFSERAGYVTRSIQRESVDLALRNAIWNVIAGVVAELQKHALALNHESRNFLNAIWAGHWHQQIDALGINRFSTLKTIRQHYEALQWHGVLDLVEFLAPRWEDDLNRILEEHMSAYRLVSNKLIEVTDKASIEAIESGMADSAPYASVRAHLQTAVERLADRPHPDFRNSMKEA